MTRRPAASTEGGARIASRSRAPLRDRFGVCQWFHYDDHRSLERAARLLRELGVRHLRTGISWADYHRPGGPRWARDLFAALSDFEILLSVWHTPPSISEGNHCASPPRRLLDYADFIDHLITEHGPSFAHLELWNEPNNRYKWDFRRHDPDWRKFGEMIGCAAYWARQRGKPTVLGGSIPVDPHWLHLMDRYGVVEHLDVVGIHGFPDMWWDGPQNWEWHRDWRGWPDKVATANQATGLPVWITETGLATWDVATRRPARHQLQLDRLQIATTAPAPRTYWYQLVDLDPTRPAIEGFHVDENEYHLGLVTHAGKKKPAFFELQSLLATS